jgi:hypothetical protein
MVVPVDLVEEPVEDDEEHRDRDEGDDGLELLAVACQRVEHGLRHDEREHRGDHGTGRTEKEWSAQTPLHAGHARDEGGQDEHRLEPLAKDDDGGVGDDCERRLRTRADGLLGVCERPVEG